MNRKRTTSSLKQAIAFAFCCFCIFLYVQHASGSESNDTQRTETHCCHNCGTANGCEVGDTWLDLGFPRCELERDESGQILGCHVGGEQCECGG